MFHYSQLFFATKFASVCFILIACVGLVVGTFELAFKHNTQQVVGRMILHALSIPIGATFGMVQDRPDAEITTVLSYCRLLVVFCLLTVGTIGLCVASVELGVIPWSENIVQRIAIYGAAIVLSIVLSPLSFSVQVKKE